MLDIRSLASRRRAAGSFGIQIEGRPLGDGGVSMQASQVTLGPPSEPSLYRGRLIQLRGTRLLREPVRRHVGVVQLDREPRDRPGESASDRHRDRRVGSAAREARADGRRPAPAQDHRRLAAATARSASRSTSQPSGRCPCPNRADATSWSRRSSAAGCSGAEAPDFPPRRRCAPSAEARTGTADRRRERRRGGAGEPQGPGASRSSAAPGARWRGPRRRGGRRRRGDRLRQARRDGGRSSASSSRSASEPRATASRSAWSRSRPTYVAGEESALVNYLNTGRALPTFVPPAALRARRRWQADADPERRDARQPGADRAPRRGVVSEPRDAGGSRLEPGHARRRGRRAGRLRGAERPAARDASSSTLAAPRPRFSAFLVGGYAGSWFSHGARPGSAARPRSRGREAGGSAPGSWSPCRPPRAACARPRGWLATWPRNRRDSAGRASTASARSPTSLEEISEGVGRARHSSCGSRNGPRTSPAGVPAATPTARFGSLPAPYSTFRDEIDRHESGGGVRGTLGGSWVLPLPEQARPSDGEAAGQPDRLRGARTVRGAVSRVDHARRLGLPDRRRSTDPGALLEHAQRAADACPTLALLLDSTDRGRPGELTERGSRRAPDQ